MSVFDQYDKRTRLAGLTAAFALPVALAAPFFAGWIFFLVYAAVRPDAWPYIGLWSAFGISYLFTYIVNRARGV